MKGRISPKSLEWERSSPAPGDWGYDAAVELRAKTPFGTDYVIHFNTEKFDQEMYEASDQQTLEVEFSVAQEILRKYGDPSEMNPNWEVSLESEASDIVGDTPIATGLVTMNAQCAAFLDYQWRVNKAVGIEYDYPNFDIAFNLMTDKESI